MPFDWGSWLGPLTIFGPLAFGVALALLVLWACLPFAVFGTKGRLNHVIALLERIAFRGGSAASREAPARPLGDLFQRLRQELLQSDRGLAEEALRPGEVELLRRGGGGREKVAGMRVAEDVIEISLDLPDLAPRTPALRPEDLRERLAAALAGRPGLRALLSPDLTQLIIQVRPEADVGEVRDLLRSQVFGFQPPDKAIG